MPTFHTQKSTVWVAGTISVLILAGLGGIALYVQRIKSSVPSGAQSTPVLTQPVQPTATPAATQTYNIQIYNGSGINGDAAKAKALLEAAQFTVSSIGNTEDPNYTETVIQTPKNVPSVYLEKLRQALSEIYIVSSETKSDTTDNTITITVGKSRK